MAQRTSDLEIHVCFEAPGEAVSLTLPVLSGLSSPSFKGSTLSIPKPEGPSLPPPSCSPRHLTLHHFFLPYSDSSSFSPPREQVHAPPPSRASAVSGPVAPAPIVKPRRLSVSVPREPWMKPTACQAAESAAVCITASRSRSRYISCLETVPARRKGGISHGSSGMRPVWGKTRRRAAKVREEWNRRGGEEHSFSGRRGEGHCLPAPSAAARCS